MRSNDNPGRDFSEVFSGALGEEICNLFKGVEVLRVNLLKKTNTATVYLKSDRLLPAAILEQLEKDLSGVLSATVKVEIQFNLGLPLEKIVADYSEGILSALQKASPSCGTLIFGSRLEVKSNEFLMHLAGEGAEVLNIKKCNVSLENIIFNMFGYKVKVKFINGDKQYIDPAPPQYIPEPEPYIEPQQTSAKKQNKKPPLPKNIIVGKEFNMPYTKICDVTQDLASVAICGSIFNIEAKEVKGGKYIIILGVTDFSCSITVKFFVSQEDYEAVMSKLYIDASIKLKGSAQYDRFLRETIIFVRDALHTDNICEVREDNAKEKRVELHLHTRMSAMDGVTSMESFVKRAAKWGHPAIAVTDHGVVQAFPDAYSAAKKNKIKMIYGIECYLLDDTKGGDDFKKFTSYHAVILVKNQVGLKNLYKIISESHLDFFHKKPRVPKKLLDRYREGLILGSACQAGEVYNIVMHSNDQSEINKVADYYDYFEVQPLGNNRFLIGLGKVSGDDELKDINRKIIKLGETLKKLVVATCDVHFMDPSDEIYRRILMAGSGFADADKQAPLYYRTTAEMLQEFDYLSDETAYEVVVTNTNKIANMIENVIPIPDGTFPPNIDGAEEQIKTFTAARAKEIYGETLPEIVEKRIQKELDSIIKNGFSVMYIIARELVLKSVSEGYLVGSRGSVGSSLVAYLIGITEVNSLAPHYICKKCKHSEFISDEKYSCGVDLPDKICPVCGEKLSKDGYDIPFETFLGFEGDKEPDIDLNFSSTYQPMAHKNVEELFGQGHVYRAGTISTIADKTAFGFVKGYFDDRGKTISGTEINRLVKGCTGVKKTTGQHPGGVMIVPQDKEIFDFCPVQRPADDVSSGVITTHFDYHSISGRLLKLDLLGHDDPTMIKMLEDLTGIKATDIIIGDRKTMDIFGSTESLGVSPDEIRSPVGTIAVPEFGTKFVRQMLEDTKPTTFAELIKISGLSHGTDVWLNNAQDLVRAGTATLSEVICTRDDIMLYLIYKGLPPKTAFKIMEDVRKGKGLKPEYQQAMEEYKVPEWYIQSCKKIKYMFPKAHAAAYVMMAFRIAWFKVYHPAAFYTAYFTVRAGDFDASIMMHEKQRIEEEIRDIESRGNEVTQKEKNTLTILEVVNEMYARGIKFLPIDLYKSDAVNFLMTGSEIRPPLNALQGLGETAALNIVEARKQGNFISAEDLRIKSKISKAVIEILEQHGCLGGLPKTSQISLF